MPVGSARASVTIGGDSRELNRELDKTESRMGAFGKRLGKSVASAFGKVGSFLSRSLDPIGRGWDLMMSGADEVRELETGIARMAIAQGKSVDEMRDYRKILDDVSGETGIARTELLRGASAYQALTGDTVGGTKALRTFARVAQATGSAVEDVATTGAALTQNLGVAPEDLERAFGILNTQGKAGAIELRDLAGEMASLTPQFTRFAGGKGLAGMQEMGSAAQIIRRNFSSASEAGTGFRSLMTSIVRNAKKLERAGVKVFDKNPKTGKKTLRSFSSIIESIGRSKLMKDPTKLTDALGSSEAERALSALTGNWTAFTSLVKAGGEDSIGKDLATYLESPAGKLETSMNNMKRAAAEAFTPERIERFAELIDQAAGAMARLSSAIGTAWDGINEGARSVFGNDVGLFNDDIMRGHVRRVGSTPLQTTPSLNPFGEGGLIEGFSQGDYDIGRQLELASELAQDKRNAIALRQRNPGYIASDARVPEVAAGMGGGGLLPASARNAIAQAIARELKKIDVRVVADGNQVARTSANASDNRRHP